MNHNATYLPYARTPGKEYVRHFAAWNSLGKESGKKERDQPVTVREYEDVF